MSSEYSPQPVDDEDEYHEFLQYEFSGRRDEEEEQMYYLEMQERAALGRQRHVRDTSMTCRRHVP